MSNGLSASILAATMTAPTSRGISSLFASAPSSTRHMAAHTIESHLPSISFSAYCDPAATASTDSANSAFNTSDSSSNGTPSNHTSNCGALNGSLEMFRNEAVLSVLSSTPLAMRLFAEWAVFSLDGDDH
ncbi:hypothetical protein BJ741DRAFT_670655 [Chytriomyces cf. hyalinus JEL632]|nr:hypothetical protein BJ741DRAFT_670655 [Chytriomyces cf. hyalinus JEL632]